MPRRRRTRWWWPGPGLCEGSCSVSDDTLHSHLPTPRPSRADPPRGTEPPPCNQQSLALTGDCTPLHSSPNHGSFSVSSSGTCYCPTPFKRDRDAPQLLSCGCFFAVGFSHPSRNKRARRGGRRLRVSHLCQLHVRGIEGPMRGRGLRLLCSGREIGGVSKDLFSRVRSERRFLKELLFHCPDAHPPRPLPPPHHPLSGPPPHLRPWTPARACPLTARGQPGGSPGAARDRIRDREGSAMCRPEQQRCA